MSVKSFVAGAATVALPIALAVGIMHFTHEYPAFVRVEVPVPAIAKSGSVWFVKHCSKPVLMPAPAKRHHLLDDGGP